MSSQQAFVFENSIYIQANRLCHYFTQNLLPNHYSSPAKLDTKETMPLSLLDIDDFIHSFDIY